MIIDWLRARLPDVQALSEAELDAVAGFSLLWSLFEARLLDGRANAGTICDLVAQWDLAGCLADDPYCAEFRYFQSRYHRTGEFTDRFDGLRLRPNDREALVRSAFDGTDTTTTIRTSAVFIVIYRYRNNLFHGAKWAYQLAGQLDNFNHANTALMTALDRSAALCRE